MTGNLSDQIPAPGWLKKLREKAFPLLENDYPDTKPEDFRYTDLTLLRDKNFAPGGELVSPVENNNDIILTPDSPYSAKGISATPVLSSSGELFQVFARDYPTARNTVHFDQGLEIVIDAALDSTQVIRLAHAYTRGENLIRNGIKVKANCSATIVEEFSGTADGLINAITEIELEPGANLNYVRLNRQDKNSVHLGGLYVRQTNSSRFNAKLLNLGASLGRLTGSVDLQEEGCEAHLGGLAVMDGERHSDFTIDMEHNASHTTSVQLFHNLAEDNSSVAFTGTVKVPVGVKGIDADQMNRSVLSSASAIAYSRPQLDILADEVKCSHGSTTGKPDEDAIFYMRSRGIDETTARELQKLAFVFEVIKDLKPVSIYDEITRALFPSANNLLKSLDNGAIE